MPSLRPQRRCPAAMPSDGAPPPHSPQEFHQAQATLAAERLSDASVPSVVLSPSSELAAVSMEGALASLSLTAGSGPMQASARMERTSSRSCRTRQAVRDRPSEGSSRQGQTIRVLVTAPGKRAGKGSDRGGRLCTAPGWFQQPPPRNPTPSETLASGPVLRQHLSNKPCSFPTAFFPKGLPAMGSPTAFLKLTWGLGGLAMLLAVNTSLQCRMATASTPSQHQGCCITCWMLGRRLASAPKQLGDRW